MSPNHAQQGATPQGGARAAVAEDQSQAAATENPSSGQEDCQQPTAQPPLYEIGFVKCPREFLRDLMRVNGVTHTQLAVWLSINDYPPSGVTAAVAASNIGMNVNAWQRNADALSKQGLVHIKKQRPRPNVYSVPQPPQQQPRQQPQAESQSQAPSQPRAQPKAQQGEDLKTRKTRFYEEVKEYVNPNTREKCNQFFRYWTELTPDRQRMRFETQDCWDTYSRFKRFRCID